MGQTHTIGKHATTVQHFGTGWVDVKYHGTVVVHMNPQTRQVKLNSGGWRTATTKIRMNQAATQYGLNFMVYQQNFEWFLQLGTGWGLQPVPIPFTDGMEFTA